MEQRAPASIRRFHHKETEHLQRQRRGGKQEGAPESPLSYHPSPSAEMLPISVSRNVKTETVITTIPVNSQTGEGKYGIIGKSGKD